MVLPWLVAIGADDLRRSSTASRPPDDAVRNLPKLVWVLLILLFPVVGPIAWFIAGRPERPPAAARPQAGPGPSHPPRPPRGPDDDPDFLRKL